MVARDGFFNLDNLDWRPILLGAVDLQRAYRCGRTAGDSWPIDGTLRRGRGPPRLAATGGRTEADSQRPQGTTQPVRECSADSARGPARAHASG